MSAIEARIRAFESLKQEQSKTAARKQPIKLYEPDNEDNTTASNAPSTSLAERDKDTSEDAHELSVGSLTSDFVKVSPPRAKAPPLPPRKESSNTSSSSPSIPSTPSSEVFVSNGTSKTRPGSVPRSPPTPKPIPQKNRPSTLGSPGRMASPSTGAFGGGVPSPNSLTVNNRFSKGHVPTPSASSFHSVSLSDHDQHPAPLESHPPSDHEDRESGLGGSYEAVHISPHGGSVFSLVDRTGSMTSSPATSVSNLGPPALPPRHGSGNISPNHTSNGPDLSNPVPVPYAVRKVPPPPGQNRGIMNKGQRPPLDNLSPRSSPRTSLVSTTSTSTTPLTYNSANHSSLSRTPTAASSSYALQSISKRKPPPLPPAARARYDAVFDANIKAQQKRNSAKEAGKDRPSSMQRRAVGWRGTSVDLTTGDDSEEVSRTMGMSEEERLSGRVVRLVWECSKLPKGILRVIWDECDSHHRGSLDKAEFANGMWRIDNELLSAASSRSDKAGSRRSYGGASNHNTSSQSRW